MSNITINEVMENIVKDVVRQELCVLIDKITAVVEDVNWDTIDIACKDKANERLVEDLVYTVDMFNCAVNNVINNINK